MRSVRLQDSVSLMESEINRLLSTYFESEFKVGLSSQDLDNLEVLVTKDGFDCAFETVGGRPKTTTQAMLHTLSNEGSCQ